MSDNVSLVQSFIMPIKACSFADEYMNKPGALSRKLNNKMSKLIEKINEAGSKNFWKKAPENAGLQIIKIRIFFLTMMTVLCRYYTFNKIKLFGGG